MAQADDERFEEDVRAIAGQLFPNSATRTGRYLDGRERDGIFDDGDTVHIFEATTSRKKEKVESDIAKSVALVSTIRREKPSHNVKIWIVTADPPTVDQEAAGVDGRKKARCPIEIISYSALYSRLFNAREFLQLRARYPFGSVRRPEDESIDIPESDYVQVALVDRVSGEAPNAADLGRRTIDGAIRAVILGDYGAGKSMALRHIYSKMAADFQSGRSSRFPVYLNLRDHFGQSDPAEALMRHATKLGLPAHNRLIGAWRAGFADIILDGFDELSPAQFATTSKNLRLARRAAAELVSQFVAETPRRVNLFISGRRHYFDSLREMYSALGVDDDWRVYDLNELTDAQIHDFLNRKGRKGAVPPWLPRRPLLIGYLAAWGLLDETMGYAEASAADGWDYLLNRICEREVRQIPGAGIEPGTLRSVLERLATYCRAFEGGRGPIPAERISTAYEEVFSQPPDARTQTLLLRLPGLASVAGQENAREFLDDDFVDACRAGDVKRFLDAPYSRAVDFAAAEIGVGSVATQGISSKISGMTEKQVTAAAEHAVSEGYNIISVDILRGAMNAAKPVTNTPVVVRDSYINDFEVYSELNYSSVTFQDCWFEQVELFVDQDAIRVENLPSFRDCVILAIAGIKGESELPAGKFKGTEIETYRGLGTTNAELLTSDIPLSVAVLLTILKKTFFQAGGGRQEAALYRGLDHRAKSYVSDVLDLLEQEGFLRKSTRAGPTLWLAEKSRAAEAMKIREAPMTSRHPLIKRVRAL